MNIVRIVLSVVVALAFGFFSIVKIAGVPDSLFQDAKEAIIDRYGISRGGMRLIGLMELTGAILVLAGVFENFTQLGQVGNGILMIVTAGAMYFHNRYDSVMKDGLPAVIQFTLNTILLILSFVLAA